MDARARGIFALSEATKKWSGFLPPSVLVTIVVTKVIIIALLMD